MDKKSIKKFEKLIKKYGLTLGDHKGGHYVVLKEGKYVSSVSHSGKENSYRLAVQSLVKNGHLPPETKRIKFG